MKRSERGRDERKRKRGGVLNEQQIEKGKMGGEGYESE